MLFHSENLNDKQGKRQGWILRHGRCWLHFSCHNNTLAAEWCFQLCGPALELDLAHGSDDAAIGIHMGLIFFSFWLHFTNFRLERWISEKIKRPDEKYGNGRSIGFYWFQGTLWIHFWHDPMESRSADPWWWEFTFTPMDFFFGRVQCTHREIEKYRVEVPMPEACYPATVSIQEWKWKRSRLPWANRHIRSEITTDKPIPFPGKGENAWDCGEDATQSMMCGASTPAEAVAKLVESVLHDRYRNGGKLWRPQVGTIEST